MICYHHRDVDTNKDINIYVFRIKQVGTKYDEIKHIQCV